MKHIFFVTLLTLGLSQVVGATENVGKVQIDCGEQQQGVPARLTSESARKIEEIAQEDWDKMMKIIKISQTASKEKYKKLQDEAEKLISDFITKITSIDLTGSTRTQ